MTEPNPEKEPQTQPAAPTEPKEDTYTRSDLDREADKRVASALAKYKKDEQERLEKAKTEGERLAKMSADEQAAEALKHRESELKERENKIAAAELKTATVTLLQKNGLPDTMSDQLIGLGNAEAIASAVDTIKTSIDERVNAKVEELAAGSAPETGSSNLDGANDPFNDIMAKYEK